MALLGRWWCCYSDLNSHRCWSCCLLLCRPRPELTLAAFRNTPGHVSCKLLLFLTKSINRMSEQIKYWQIQLKLLHSVLPTPNLHGSFRIKYEALVFSWQWDELIDDICWQMTAKVTSPHHPPVAGVLEWRPDEVCLGLTVTLAARCLQH